MRISRTFNYLFKKEIYDMHPKNLFTTLKI